MQRNKLGSFQIIIASICFGALPLLTRIGYAGGANATTLLAIRFMIAAALLWGYLWVTGTKIQTTWKQVAVFFTVGIGGFGVMAYTYFNSFLYIPSSMAAVIMFTYPVIVTYLSAVFLETRITGGQIIALILVTSGAIVMSSGEMTFHLVGILLACTSAVFYAMYIVYLGSSLTFRQEPKVLSAFITLAVAIFFTAFGAIRGELHFNLTGTAWTAVILMSIFSTVVAIMVFYAGVQKVGSSTAAIISTVEPVTALVLGITVLGESVTVMRLLGAVLIFAGVLYVQLPTRKPKIDWKARI